MAMTGFTDLVAFTWANPNSNSDGTSGIDLDDSSKVLAQEFRVPHTISCTHVRVFVKCVGGDWPLEVGICGLDGSSNPDHNNPLCSTERAFAATTGTYGNPLEVEFSSPATLSAGTKYCVYIKYGTGGTTTTTYTWYHPSTARSAFVGQTYTADVYNWLYSGSWSNPYTSSYSFALQVFGTQSLGEVGWNRHMTTDHTSSKRVSPDSANTWYAQQVKIANKGELQTLGIPFYVFNLGATYKGFKIQITGDNGSDEPDMTDIMHTENIDHTQYTNSSTRGYIQYFDISASAIAVEREEKIWIVIGGPRDGETGSSTNYFNWYLDSGSGYFYNYGHFKYTSNGGSSWATYSTANRPCFKLYQTNTEDLVVDQENGMPYFPNQSEGCTNQCSTYYWNASRILFQTFTPNSSGTLRELWLGILPYMTSSGAYTIRVYEADGDDEPTGDVLAEITSWDPLTDPYNFGRSGTYDPQHSLIKFDFTTDGASLEGGTKYGIWIQASTYYYNGMKPIYYNSDKWAGGIAHDYIYSSWNTGMNGTASTDMPLMVVLESGLEFPLDSSLCKVKVVDATLSKTFADTLSINSTLQGSIDDALELDSCLTYVDNKSRHKVSMSFGQGVPQVGVNIDGGRAMARKARIARIFTILDDTGTAGSDTIVDINIDGVSVFTDQDSRPTIVGGSTTKISQRQTIVKNIDSGSVITVDVDSVASGARKLTVIVELNVATSYTHTVRRVDILDTGMVVNTTGNYEGFTSGQLQFKIIFDEPMDTAVEPTITWTPNTMVGTPTIPPKGAWSSTYESGDTYLTPMIDSSSTSYVGVADILINGCKNVFSEDIESFQFSLNLSNDSLVAWEYGYTNEITNTLKLGSSIIIDFMYSFDQVSWSSWTNYTSEIDIDLDDAAIGGTGTEGTKILYVKLRDGAGNIITKSATIVYKLTIGQIVNFEIIPTLKKNFYMLKWDLPTDAGNAPVRNFIISLDGTQLAKIDSVYPLNLTASLSTIAVDDGTEEITYTMAAGTSWGPYGTLFTLAGGTVTSDYPEGAPRYDVVGVNSSGEYQVISGAEGLVTRTPSPWETEFGKQNLATGQYPNQPSLPAGFLPIAYIWVGIEYWIQYTSGTEYTEKYLARVYDDNVYELSVDKISCVVEIVPSADQQSLTIQTVSVTGLTSTYTYTISQTSSAPVELIEIQTWSETDGGGTQMTNGGIVRDTDLTNNYVYLKFVKEDE